MPVEVRYTPFGEFDRRLKKRFDTAFEEKFPDGVNALTQPQQAARSLDIYAIGLGVVRGSLRLGDQDARVKFIEDQKVQGMRVRMNVQAHLEDDATGWAFDHEEVGEFLTNLGDTVRRASELGASTQARDFSGSAPETGPLFQVVAHAKDAIEKGRGNEVCNPEFLDPYMEPYFEMNNALMRHELGGKFKVYAGRRDHMVKNLADRFGNMMVF